MRDILYIRASFLNIGVGFMMPEEMLRDCPVNTILKVVIVISSAGCVYS